MSVDHNATLDQFPRWFASRRDSITDDLMNYLSVDTTSPHEPRAETFLREYLGSIGAQLERLPGHPDLADHPSRSPHAQSIIGADRASWRSTLAEGAGCVRTVFNAHVDVVPSTPDFPDAFTPRRDGDMIIGRGACDTKNNLVMLVEAVRFLHDAGIPLWRTPILDLPIEEEIGGNGTLSLILHDPGADEAVCLEPTSLQVLRGHRGCLSFRVDIRGRSVHMGSTATGLDAIAGAIDVAAALRELERTMLAEAADEPGFEGVTSPLQLNIGKIQGGEWSGSLAERCTLWADLGFLPSMSLDDVAARVDAACRSIPDQTMAGQLKVRFDIGLRNDAYLTPPGQPVVDHLARAVGRHIDGVEPPRGWRVSCDARLYSKIAGLPTVIFGSGSLADAHSPHERISLAELETGIAILARFLSASRHPGDADRPAQ
ncbi:M20 family metallopeptidase [Nocardia gipuzkoensis]